MQILPVVFLFHWDKPANDYFFRPSVPYWPHGLIYVQSVWIFIPLSIRWHVKVLQPFYCYWYVGGISRKSESIRTLPCITLACIQSLFIKTNLYKWKNKIWLYITIDYEGTKDQITFILFFLFKFYLQLLLIYLFIYLFIYI